MINFQGKIDLCNLIW